MQATQLRPTFTVTLPLSAREAAAAMRFQILEQGLQEHTRSAGLVTEFFIDPSDCRYWSPYLSTQLHDTEAGQSELFGRFSPRPEVWTLVMALYMMAVCLMFAAMIWGYAQWMLHETPWALLLIPALLLLIALLHVAGMIGRRWSRDQILLLRDRLERVLQPIAADQAIISRIGFPKSISNRL